MQSKSTLFLSPGSLLNDRYQVGELVSGGAQGQIFDVIDLDDSRPPYPQVVKVIPNPATARKLKTEAEKLSQMSHLGIPKIEGPSAFFEHIPDDRFILLSCLVMEKIEGTNLLDWFASQDYQPISERRAIAWLKQLVDILKTVHSNGYIHRDIKPENIMVRSNGPKDQLVLIDFGIGRDETESFYDKQQHGSLTRAGTTGYHAPEQMDGRSLPASDFYSVGRTFVYLLTGVIPSNLPKGRNYQLFWRNKATHISDYLADLIDDLMQVEVAKRDRTIQALDKRIKFIETLPPKGNLIWRELPWILVLGGLISGFWIGVRLLGLLQPIELITFDWMMRSRPLEQPDPHLVIVAINEEDIEYQKSQGMDLREGSLSDKALSLLLEKIYQYPNNVTGLDLVRDFPTDPKFANVIARLEEGDRLIAGCQHIDVSRNHSGYRPPPEATLVAFVDGIPDTGWGGNEISRRHLLMMHDPDETPCNTNEYGLSTLVAIRYLADQDFEVASSQDIVTRGQLIIGEKRFQNLLSRQGPYQNLDTEVQDIVLNYRATRSVFEIGATLSLIDILNPEFDTSVFQNKIILIGGTAGEIDRHDTPLAKNVPGVYVQAHEVSQIVSYVLDDRPLINLGRTSYDTGLMLIVGMAIAPLIWLSRTLWIRSLVTLGLMAGSTTVCLYIFWQAYWLPVVPISLIIISYPLVLWWVNKYVRQYSQTFLQ